MATHRVDSRYVMEIEASNANLTGVDLTRVWLVGANLTGANLTGVNLTGGYFVGPQLNGATCPNGIVHGQSGADC